EIVLEKYGLNDPVPVQYVRYLGKVAKGDLGISFQFSNTPVSKIIKDRIGPSMQLGFQSLVIGTFLGILLGMIALIFRNGFLDYVYSFLAVLGTSVTSFVFAGLLQLIFSVNLDCFLVALWEGFEYSILPTVALMIFHMATA